MKKKMTQKTLIDLLAIATVVALAPFATVCGFGGGSSDSDSDSDGDSDNDTDLSDEEYCQALCDKLLDECASEYAEAEGLDEDEVEERLDDCLADCEPNDDNEEYYDCLEEACDEYGYPSECTSIEVDYSAMYDCELAADCDDLVEFIAGTGDVCEDERDDVQDAIGDAEGDCEDALEDMDTDDLTNFNDAATECYDEYYDTDA